MHFYVPDSDFDLTWEAMSQKQRNEVLVEMFGSMDVEAETDDEFNFQRDCEVSDAQEE
jgi:hypothetical protein